MKFRIALCVSNAQRAALWREKLDAVGSVLVLDPLWEHPEIAWVADAAIVSCEDATQLAKITALDFCPAILSDKIKEDVSRLASPMKPVPFACVDAEIATDKLRDLMQWAGAHTRMAWAQRHADIKQPILREEPALSLEAMSSFLKRWQAGSELLGLVGDIFARWSHSPRVMLIGFPGNGAEEMEIQYCSVADKDISHWKWHRDEPWIKEIERHNGAVKKEGAPPTVLRWMHALDVANCTVLRHNGVFLGLLAFADRPGQPFAAKEMQSLNGVISRISQMLLAGLKPGTGSDVPTDAPHLAAASKEVLRKQQLDIIGRMAMRSSHELKNCLVSIRTFTQLFPEKYADEQFRKDFYAVVSREVERLNGLVEKLLFFAQPVQLKLTQEKITDLISEAFTLFPPEDMQVVQLHKVFSHHQPTLWLDRQQMLAVFFHIVQNSLQALSSGGKLVVVTEDHPHPDYAEGVLVLRFLDTGRGMTLKDREEPFEPFYSTKARGIGLGLTIAKRIVEEHGGTIRLESSKEKGTEVILCLPRKIPQWDGQVAAQDIAEVSQA